MSLLQEPLDLIRLALAEVVEVKCRGDRTLTGKLHAYDAHLNMVLADAEEVCLVDESAPQGESSLRLSGTQQVKRQMPMVFVRGDGIILISTKSSQ